MFETVITWLEWNPEFGASDMISVIVAFLTLGAVLISAQASASAKESAKIAEQSTRHMEEQTIIMTKQYDHETLPMILPVSTTFSANYHSILTQLNKDNDWTESHPGDMYVDIQNVGKGNAYYVQSWIELENIEHFYNISEISSENLMSPFDPYTITFFKHEQIYNEMIIKEWDFLDGNKLMAMKKLPIFHTPSTISSLKTSETTRFVLPSYVQILILDFISRRVDPEYTPSENDYIFYLYCRYRTSNQFNGNDSTLVKFKVNIHSIRLQLGAEQGFEFSIYFDPVNSNL